MFIDSADKNSVKIKCVIDRIDQLEDLSLRVIDYKYSGSNPHHALWFKTGLSSTFVVFNNNKLKIRKKYI